MVMTAFGGRIRVRRFGVVRVSARIGRQFRWPRSEANVVFLFIPDLLVVSERIGSHLTRHFVRTGEHVLFGISIPIRSSSQESASAEALSCESAVSTLVAVLAFMSVIPTSIASTRPRRRL